MNKIFKVIFAVFILVLLTAAYVTRTFWYPGITPNQTADILINDVKYGSRGIKAAIFFGVKIIKPLQTVSNNYEKLNGRNSFWLAEIFSDEHANISTEFLQKLYESKNYYARLVAIIALFSRDKSLEVINDESFLIQIIQHKLPHSINARDRIPYEELAIIALGKSQNKEAIPFLTDVLNDTSRSYWQHAYACNAMAEIGDINSISLLRSKLKDSSFKALPEAFAALNKLGDSKVAIEIAIAKLPEIKDEFIRTRLKTELKQAQ